MGCWRTNRTNVCIIAYQCADTEIVKVSVAIENEWRHEHKRRKRTKKADKNHGHLIIVRTAKHKIRIPYMIHSLYGSGLLGG
jgi:hypothetical protein